LLASPGLAMKLLRITIICDPSCDLVMGSGVNLCP
jgi:hypothetical protein